MINIFSAMLSSTTWYDCIDFYCCWIIFCLSQSDSVSQTVQSDWTDSHGPLTRYVKLQVAHAPGMTGTFPPADFKGNRWLATPSCITARASRTCRDACRNRLPAVAGKTFPAFPAHAHLQFYVSGKRPMGWWFCLYFSCRTSVPLHTTMALRMYSTRVPGDHFDFHIISKLLSAL